jgi:hypothetical protein
MGYSRNCYSQSMMLMPWLSESSIGQVPKLFAIGFVIEGAEALAEIDQTKRPATRPGGIASIIYLSNNSHNRRSVGPSAHF